MLKKKKKCFRKTLKKLGYEGVPVKSMTTKRAAKAFRLEQKAAKLAGNTASSSPATKLITEKPASTVNNLKATAAASSLSFNSNGGKTKLEFNGLKINFPSNLKFSIHEGELNFE